MPFSKNWDEFKLRKKYGEAGLIYAAQLELSKKAQLKLPSFFKQNCFYNRVALEQATPEAVAKVKARRYGKGNILSLCGGLGADEFAFAEYCNHITSIDYSEALNQLVLFNGIFEFQKYERITTTAEEFLQKNKDTYQLVYVDPDRRTLTGKKSYSPANYSPDFLELYKNHGEIAPQWLVKLSPAIDLEWIKTNISYPFDIDIYALDGEIKEILLILHKNGENTISVFECSGSESFGFTLGNELPEAITVETELFIEASALSIKSGYSAQWSSLFGLTALNSNNTYFKGNIQLPKSLARTFKLVKSVEGSFNEIRKALKEEGILRAVISSRELGLPTNEVYKILDMKEGDGTGEFLFINKAFNNKKNCYVTQQL